MMTLRTLRQAESSARRLPPALSAKASGQKKPFEGRAGMVPLPKERRARPETEQLLSRWGKSCVFLSLLA